VNDTNVFGGTASDTTNRWKSCKSLNIKTVEELELNVRRKKEDNGHDDNDDLIAKEKCRRTFSAARLE
jgi:hypothetical protein